MARFSARPINPSRVMRVGSVEPGLHQVSQPEHAAQAVRVRVDVGNKYDPIGRLEAGQEPVRTA